MYPTAQRLLAHCDAVLRLPGESTGADQDVAIARQRGLPVYHRLQEIPGYQPERADDHSPAARRCPDVAKGEDEANG